MITLKEALEKDRLKQFIKERENAPAADKERFDTALDRMLKEPVKKAANKTKRHKDGQSDKNG